MTEEKFEAVIFKSKTFGKLLEEIHSNSRNTDKQVYQMIEQLNGYIESLGDAISLAPIIATYVKMAIDNNEHIIKLASIVQKVLDRGKVAPIDDFTVFTDEDKKELEATMLEWEQTMQLPEVAGVDTLMLEKSKKSLPEVAGKVGRKAKVIKQ